MHIPKTGERVFVSEYEAIFTVARGQGHAKNTDR